MTAVAVCRVQRPRRLSLMDDPRITRQLVIGVSMLTAIGVFAIVGPLVVDPSAADIGAVTPRLPPNAQHFLGTDSQGRDLWTVMALGTPNSLKIGLIAGIFGIGIGLVLGMISGFVGGAVDTVIRVCSDALMTVPAIAILIVIASNVERMSVELMGVAIALLAWMFPTRVIRSQVLSIKERSYIEVAKANGVGTTGLIVREVMPNLMPWVMAAFVGTVAGAILAAVGLESLGLGATSTETIGVTIFWSQYYSAVPRGMWWWWAPPIFMIGLVFVALFVTSAGMDRFANPRLQRD